MVPKTSGEGYCTVINCSKPAGHFVNNYVDEVSKTCSQLGVNDLVKMLIKGDFITTIDIKDAYRAISIHPEDHSQQVMQWDWFRA